jgi:putative ABC transport system permease protein
LAHANAPPGGEFVKFLGLVWGNLKRKKLRTALTLLSILVAFLLFGFLCAIKEAFLGGVTLAGADRLVVRHKVSIIQSLPQSYGQRIANMPGVAAVAPQSWFGGIYQEPKNFFASIPVEPESFLDMFPEFILPADQKAAWLKTRTGAIVGKATMDRFKWKIGDHVPITSPIWGEPEGQSHWDFEIVGSFTGAKKGTDTSGFYFRYDYFDEARPRGKGQIGWMTVRVKNPDDTAAIAQKIDEEFANSPYETKAEPEGAFMAGFAQQMGNIGTIMIAVLSAVFFTILLVVGNTMGQAVRERTEELGVLKAMGFTNELVLTLVLLESCVIAAVGGLAGLGIAWLITLGGSPAPGVFPVFYIPNHDLLMGLAIVVALGVAAGLLPAIQAMRLQIAEALRRNA